MLLNLLNIVFLILTQWVSNIFSSYFIEFPSLLFIAPNNKVVSLQEQLHIETALRHGLLTAIFILIIALIYIFYAKRKLNEAYKEVKEAKKKSLLTIENSDENIKKIFYNAQDALLIIEKNKIIDCNKSSTVMFGFNSREDLIGQGICDISADNQENGENSGSEATKYINRAIKNKTVNFKWIHKRANGEIFPAEIILSEIFYNKKKVIHAVIKDHTEIIKTQQDLYDKNEQYQIITEASEDVIFMINKYGKILYANHKQEEVFGRKNENVVGTNFLKYVTKAEFQKYIAQLKNVLIDRGIKGLETTMLDINGEEIDIEVNAKLIKNRGKTVILGTLRDIGARKIIERELKESEHKYRSVLENMIDVYYRVDAEGRIILISDSIKSVLGYDKQEAIGRYANDFYAYPEKRNEIVRLLGKNKSVSGYKLDFLHRNGNIIITDLNVQIILDENGKYSGSEGIIRDITEKQIANDLLREKTMQFENTINNMEDVYVKADFKGNFIQVNPSILRQFEIETFDEVLKTNIFDWTDIDTEQGKVFIRTILKNKQISNFSYTFKTKKGKKQYAEMNASLFYDKDNKARGFEAIIRNVTEQKVREQEIKEKTSQLENTLNNLTDVYFRTDLEGKLMYASKSICKHLGYNNIEEAIGENIFERFFKSKNSLRKIKVEIAKNGKLLNYPVELVDNNGTLIYASINSTMWYNKNGDIGGNEGIIHNITDRVNAEIKLQNLYQELKHNSEMVAKQQEQLTESIVYAENIQRSILSDTILLNKYFDDNFIYYQPAFIVSGDFYYFYDTEENVVISVGDCTGHGVPGGFMTMLGITLLDNIVKRKDIETTSQALDLMRHKLKQTLKQEKQKKKQSVKDGIEMALCAINKKTLMLDYTGAFTPLYIVRDDELLKFEANKMPIGIHLKEKAFKTTFIQLQKGDCIYLFSDGFSDQFGGERYRKFNIKAFKQLLLSIHKKPMDIQTIILEQTFLDWKGDSEQIDDVVVFGLRI